MSQKTLTKLKAQAPRWIRIDEPVSGSTDPLNQRVNVLPDGTITFNVEGVANRPIADLWGTLLLLADIIETSHNEDGTFKIESVSETSIDFNFRQYTRPSFAGRDDLDPDDPARFYASTEDLINELHYWAAHIDRNRSLASSFFSELVHQQMASTRPNGYVKNFLTEIEGPRRHIKVADNEFLWLLGRKYNLNGANSTDTQCLVEIPAPSRNHLDGYSVAYGVFIEIFVQPVSDTNKIFPFGCLQYRNAESDPTPQIPVKHSTHFISPHALEAQEFIKNPEHNVFIGDGGKLYQRVYALRVERFNYISHKNMLRDTAVRSVYNRVFGYYDKYSGVFTASDHSSIAFPLATIIQRNAGVYHEAINPHGTAIPRQGALIRSMNDAFERNRIRYFSESGVECPNYTAAVYNETNDTFVSGGVVYYRSGLSRTHKTHRPDRFYADIVYPNDVDVYKPRSISAYRVSDYVFGKFFAGKLNTRLTPVYYGTSSSLFKEGVWGQKPLQVVGFGTSEADVFGTNNHGCVYMDFTNNGRSAYTDNIRYIWSDQRHDQPTVVWFTCGDDDSESHPRFLAYESVSGTLTLNTTGISGVPLITNKMPRLVWEDGTVSTLAWQGLGSTTAAAKLSTSDMQSKQGMRGYITCELTYYHGSGLPFKLDNILKITTGMGNNSKELQLAPRGFENSFELVGIAQSGSTENYIVLHPTASVSDAIVGKKLKLLQSAHNLPGSERVITSYDPIARTVLFDTPFDHPVEYEDVFSISHDYGNGYLQVDTYSRAIMGVTKRSHLIANPHGVAVLGKRILAASRGEIDGGLVKNLTAGEIVDIIYVDQTAIHDGLKIWFFNDYMTHQFDRLDDAINSLVDDVEFLDVGSAFVTNIGTGNGGDYTYMGTLYGVHFPVVDNIKWMGIVPTPQDFMTSRTDVRSLSWLSLMPYAGLKLNTQELTVDDTFEGKPIQLKVDAHVADPHAGVIILAHLVRGQGGLKLLVAMSANGHIDYTDHNSLFLLDISKWVGDTREG